MSSQLYFPEHEHEFKDEGQCRHCGITLSEEYQHRHHSDIRRPANERRTLEGMHVQGICVACGFADNPTTASPWSKSAVWGVKSGRAAYPHDGFGFPPWDKDLIKCRPMRWPTMSDFAACLNAQLEASAEDAFRRTIILLEHAIGILQEEILPALEKRYEKSPSPEGTRTASG